MELVIVVVEETMCVVTDVGATSVLHAIISRVKKNSFTLAVNAKAKYLRLETLLTNVLENYAGASGVVLHAVYVVRKDFIVINTLVELSVCFV